MNVLVYVIVLFAVLITVLAATRARIFQLRRVPGFSVMPVRVGEAVETGQTLHVSFGSSAVRDQSTIAALATSEIHYYLAQLPALSDKPMFVTLSDPVTLGLGQDTLRRAYKARSALSKYRSTLAQWYPQGPMSLAFAAGAGEAILDENAAANIFLGQFGSEMMLLAENAIRYDRAIIAQSNQVEGQAVAYVVSDMPLIGEELYA